jgi:REP element-mobilizing transposase RayT
VAKKWSNLNLPGALHFVTGNALNRSSIFTDSSVCIAFLDELNSLNKKWPSKLIAYVLMPDHFHLVSNPRDGRIREFIGSLKSLSSKRIIKASERFHFPVDEHGHHVWQQSFKAVCSFYLQGESSLAVDREWCWDDDVEKLSGAVKQMGHLP